MLGVLYWKNQTKTFVVKQVEHEYKLENFVDALNISITSYGFLNKVFPVFQEMEDRSYKNRLKAAFFALTFVFGVYATFSYLAIELYGDRIEFSIFSNFSKEDDLMTYGVQFLFFILFVNNIPFNFIPGKFCFINIW